MTPTKLLFCHDRLATAWSLGYTFIGDPCESLLTVEKDIVRRCRHLRLHSPVSAKRPKNNNATTKVVRQSACWH